MIFAKLFENLMDAKTTTKGPQQWVHLIGVGISRF